MEEQQNVTSKLEAVFDSTRVTLDEIRRVWLKHIDPSFMLFVDGEAVDAHPGECGKIRLVCHQSADHSAHHNPHDCVLPYSLLSTENENIDPS